MRRNLIFSYCLRTVALHQCPILLSDRCPEGPEQRFLHRYFLRFLHRTAHISVRGFDTARLGYADLAMAKHPLEGCPRELLKILIVHVWTLLDC
jgi:hypothetical protein